MEMRRGSALRADHSRLLLELSREVVSTLDVNEVYSRTLDSVRRILPFESALIRLIEGDTLLTAATTAEGDEALQVRAPADRNLAGSVASSIEPVYIGDVTPEQADDPSIRALAPDGGLRSYLGVALADGEGFLGLLEVGSSAPRAFSPDQIASAVVLAPSVAIAIRNARVAADPARRAPLVLDEDFLSLVAHELRTPLAVVLGCCETVASKAPELDPGVVADLGRRAVSAGHRLERLIADLFDMSSIRNGTMSLIPVPTSLRSIVVRAVNDAPQTLRVSLDIEERLPLVDVDPNRLVQVLRILLDNAWKHAGENAEVDICAASADGGVTVEVADRGPGIDGALLDKVFDAFVQAEEPITRKVGGLGIGLFLARGLCRLMGAGIEARERAGGGTSFVIRLETASDELEPVR